ncbi:MULTISPECIES: carboxypeptidase-like regulatory domain-containing protein [Clostridium]|uniref:Carboxypeptidase regulatory-like domain-containing protein n=1 Tax=Clostridium cibarium TaxID=2762247 RepID=A0ABR8PUU6_9CLOT|nr:MULTISPECIES: carboxypeptidase-like regulatory domain-containing protein [Clostridium]MBD7911904.1 carboxypeptidase regulatory-like domain-containing protein [Clostridium cibarium]
MPFVNLYDIGYSDPFVITGREEKTENLNLTTNEALTTGTLEGQVTSGGTGVAGATVKLFDANNEPFEHTTTDQNGNYSFENVPAGSYSVVAVAPGFLLSNSIPVTIQDDETTTINIPLETNPNANLGTVYGIITSSVGNTPIENATVTLTTVPQPGETPTTIATATTNDRGQFFFVNIPPDSYIVSASRTGFNPNQSGTLNVAANAFVTSNLILTPNTQNNTGTVSGVITDEDTNQPIANANVALYSITGGTERIIAITQTNISGRYLFANVAPGNYRVKATVQETQG